MADRTVHAASADDTVQVVRYDKAGKWYVEVDSQRLPVNLAGAIHEAGLLLADGGAVYLGQHGGAAFDRKMRETVDLSPLGAAWWTDEDDR